MKKKNNFHQFAISAKCNNNCIFCSDKNMPIPKKPYTLDNIKKSIDSLIEVNKIKGIFLTSNEPTLNKDLFRILQYMRSKKLEIKLNTNARIFSIKKNVERIKKLGITELRISIHGHNARIHDAITRSPNSFEQTAAGIKNLKSVGAYVSTNTVICKMNYQYLSKILLFLSGLKVDKIDFFGVKPTGNGKNNFELVMPRFSAIVPYIDELYKSGKQDNITFSLSNIPFCFLEHEKFKVGQKITPFYYQHDKLRLNLDTFTNKIKIDKCKSCDDYEECGGVYKIYLEKYGSEEFK